MSTASDPICTKCRTSMEKGYVPDRAGGQSANRQVWAKGEPKPWRWLGINFGIKAPDKDALFVETWRCPRCGVLESFARG
jgi:hypothetical protein